MLFIIYSIKKTQEKILQKNYQTASKKYQAAESYLIQK